MLCMRVCAELESSAYATVQVWVVCARSGADTLFYLLLFIVVHDRGPSVGKKVPKTSAERCRTLLVDRSRGYLFVDSILDFASHMCVCV